VEKTWPYEKGTENLMDSAFWTPGEKDTVKRVEELKKIYG
jgi:hypothetical protein